MVVSGLWTPVKVLHVYAADLISVALIAADGRATSDDVLVQLESVACNTIVREIDPPAPVLRMYAPNADGGRSNQFDAGPCPAGRKVAQSLLRKAKRVYLLAPVAGSGWIQRLADHEAIAGNIYWTNAGTPGAIMPSDCISLAGELLRMGHARPRSSAVA